MLDRNTIEVVFERGVFRPVQPVDLPDGTKGRVMVPAGAVRRAEGLPPLSTVLANFRALQSADDSADSSGAQSGTAHSGDR